MAEPQDERFPVFARNRYFTGRLLDADDLTDEQEYLLGKDRMRNRSLHGWGVVGGLEVVAGENDTEIVVEPGMAIDGWGREIVVSSPCRLDLASTGGRETVAHGWVTVRIAYAESAGDPVPSPIEGEEPVSERIVEGHTVLIEPGLPEGSDASIAGLPVDPSVVLATVRRSAGRERPEIGTRTYRREIRSNSELLEIVSRLQEEVARLSAERTI